MTLRLSRQQYDQLLDWGEAAGENECCGLILEAAGRVELQLVTNVAPRPDRHFEIEHEALIAAEKADRAGTQSIVGYFHSHPNGHVGPSEEDASQAANDGRIWLIIAEREITAWRKQSSSGFQPSAMVVEEG